MANEYSESRRRRLRRTAVGLSVVLALCAFLPVYAILDGILSDEGDRMVVEIKWDHSAELSLRRIVAGRRDKMPDLVVLVDARLDSLARSPGSPISPGEPSTTTQRPPRPSDTSTVVAGDSPSLRLGDHGTAVSDLKTLLRAAGTLVASVDDTFDAETEAAVRRFQTATGQAADGVVGSATWDALRRTSPTTATTATTSSTSSTSSTTTTTTLPFRPQRPRSPVYKFSASAATISRLSSRVVILSPSAAARLNRQLEGVSIRRPDGRLLRRSDAGWRWEAILAAGLVVGLLPLGTVISSRGSVSRRSEGDTDARDPEPLAGAVDVADPSGLDEHGVRVSEDSTASVGAPSRTLTVQFGRDKLVLEVTEVELVPFTPLIPADDEVGEVGREH